MFRKNIIQNHLAVIIGLFLLFTSLVSAQNSALKNEQITAKFNEYMDAAVKVDGFSGSVLVARNGKPIFDKGYGMANVEWNVPNSPQSVYRLGSVTKQFTGMAI
ncbi:MAG: serine hydrolase domain-containing protein, partial [Pyrinomonadaceae bacterium]